MGRILPVVLDNLGLIVGVFLSLVALGAVIVFTYTLSKGKTDSLSGKVDSKINSIDAIG